MRVKKTVVVDGDDNMFSEEAFKKALDEENKYIQQLKIKEKELKDKREKEEETNKIEAMKAETRRRKQKAEREKQMSTEFTRLQLKQVLDSPMVIKDNTDKTPTIDNDGNYYVNHEVDYSAVPDKKIIESIDEDKEEDDDKDNEEDE